MEFSAFFALEAYLELSIPDLIRDRIHHPSAIRFPVSWDLVVHMQGNEAVRTMIPAGLGSLGDLFSAIDTDE